MKNKLLSLVLCILMVISVILTGCGLNGSTDEEGTATTDTTGVKPTMTLNMYIPVQKGTTDEAIAAVEQAINDITQSKFKTSIKLMAIPQDEYKAAVDARITYIEDQIAADEEEEKRKREEAKRLREQNITTEATEEETEDTGTTKEETVVNDLGMKELLYPDIGDRQMDIFLIQGYDAYVEYIDRDALSILDDELNGSSKILKSYIYPAFLNSIRYNGSTYAIPNNHEVGEYKLLLVNKRLADKYYYDSGDLNTLIKCKSFIEDIAANEPNVAPLLSKVDAAGMVYWSVDGSFSLIASSVPNTASETTKVAPKNVFSIKEFTDTAGMMKQMEEKGYIAKDSAAVNEFAVGVVSGDASIFEQYEDDYYITVYEKPAATSEDIFSAMFAVSSYTKSVARSMEIITYLNTKIDLRTVLQYGIAGENYEIDKDTQLLKVLNNTYNMNLRDTGNVYMTFPGDGMGMEFWEYAKKQNLDSIVSPFLKFNNLVPAGSESMYGELAILSAEYWAKIQACPSELWEEFIVEMKSEVDALSLIVKMLDIATEAPTPGYVYEDFYTTTYPS